MHTSAVYIDMCVHIYAQCLCSCPCTIFTAHFLNIALRLSLFYLNLAMVWAYLNTDAALGKFKINRQILLKK